MSRAKLIRKLTSFVKVGNRLKGLSESARNLGFNRFASQLSLADRELQETVTEVISEIKKMMPVSCRKINEKYRVIGIDGEIELDIKGTPVDGGGYDQKEDCEKHVRSINAKGD